jgi:hypothetical protein
MTAGLAWQHTGKTLSKTELLLEHIVQNVFSQYLVASHLSPDQRLVTLSTNAIDIMMSTLSTAQKKMLEYETDAIVECLMSQRLQKNNLKDLKKIAWKLVVNHVMLSFVPALDYSYAYSKYLAEKILIRLSLGNIKVLRISDVYGPGQDISSSVINPDVPARRIQRFVAAYKLIAEENKDWIPVKGDGLHGFYKNNNEIIQEIWNDSVFPTYVDDVIDMTLQASRLPKGGQTVFETAGKKMGNKKMAAAIRDFFKVNVLIRGHGKISAVQKKSNDVPILLESKSPTSFNKGLQKWLGKTV